ncbi:hypothetical protein SUDANB121_00849 [Nocardiopsis dassonvillei]|uniref:hypothetical protein n=1 Tax=Nocardiopsis dassonvillei TaxID=2014 RepID=UPI003F5728D8
MTLGPVDNNRLVMAVTYLAHGFTLLWRAPAMVRTRAYLIALHIAPLGFVCQLFPSAYDVGALTTYTTVFLLFKTARSTSLPQQDPAEGAPDPTPT